MDKTQVIKTGYVPRAFQDTLHAELKRFNVLVCHRRFGKTVFSVNELIDKGLRNPLRNAQYAYVAPNYGQAKRVAWDMFKEFTRNIPGVKVNEAELRIDIERDGSGNRVRFMLLGAENPGSLRGIYLDGCVLDEYAEMDPTIWAQVIRPALADRRGWAIFIGTPKGQNHFYDILEIAKKNPMDWHSVTYKASQTKLVATPELKAAKAVMAPEEYDQEFECSFSAALIGSYYGKQMESLEEKNHIGEVPHDPHLQVDTYWDLGISDSTAIWFVQQLGQEIRLIDYIEESGQSLAWYAAKMKEDHRIEYNYGTHVLPHDAAARSLDTGRSRQETLRNLGLKTIILTKQKIEDGINASRVLLPKCWFDRVRCERGIKALNNYEKKWDAKNKIFSSKPLHNWASNGADAFRYVAMGLKEDGQKFENKTFQRETDNDYNVFDY
jgi:hypothetical protein